MQNFLYLYLLAKDAMKALFPSSILIALVFLVSCAQRSGEDHGEHATEQGPNQALYDEVMSVHDEVMPKMNDLYKAKATLSKQLREDPGLSEEQKATINRKIARIDSASEEMMVWMRRFNPLPDSAGEDRAKAYLEGELTKVRKVKEDILQALESAQP